MNYSKLIMVTTQNNNKYYEMKEQGDGTFIVYYGRVGKAAQSASYPMSSWNTKYKEKIRKGYIDVTDEVKEEIDEKEIDEKKFPKRKYKKINNPKIEDLLNKLQDYANKTIKRSYKISSEKVTQKMIDKTNAEINSLINVNDVLTFNEILLKIFTSLPRTMANVNNYLAKSKNDFEKIINREQDLLDVMKGQVKQNVVVNESLKTDNEDATILDLMDLDVEEASNEDINYIKMKLGSNAYRLKNVYKVINKRTQKAYDEFLKTHNNPKQKTLFHGSRNQNWWSIINSGLVLRPNAPITGKMFGYGIYFATKASKSIGYTSLRDARWNNEKNGTGYMALYKIAYGKPYDIHSFDSKYYSLNKNSLAKLDKDAMCLHAHAGKMLVNDEIIIYDETQCTIEYLVELE